MTSAAPSRELSHRARPLRWAWLLRLARAL